MITMDNFETFWTSYPSDLCKKKRGSKQVARKSFDKINPDEAEFKRIMANMRAQIKADRMDKDAYRWPFVSSYLNQARYDDFIEPTQREIRKDEKICKMDGCKQFVHGINYDVCPVHIPSRMDDRLRAAWRATGLKRKSPTLAQDCRDYCLNKGWKI